MLKGCSRGSNFQVKFKCDHFLWRRLNSWHCLCARGHAARSRKQRWATTMQQTLLSPSKPLNIWARIMEKITTGDSPARSILLWEIYRLWTILQSPSPFLSYVFLNDILYQVFKGMSPTQDATVLLSKLAQTPDLQHCATLQHLYDKQMKKIKV